MGSEHSHHHHHRDHCDDNMYPHHGHHHHHEHGHHHGGHYPPPPPYGMPQPGYVEWRSAGYGQVPAHAFEGGHDSGCLYVGRAHYGGDLIPGKVQPAHQTCYVAFAGGEHSVQNYEVLCNPNHCHLHWVPSSNGYLPPGALQGGHTSSGEPLYIGRCHHHGTQTIGKVHASHGCLYISYGGEEISHHSYEVLVCN